MNLTFGNHKRLDATIADYEKPYIKDVNDANSYKFNVELFNKLIKERRYTEAVEYGNKFMRLDPTENEEFKRSLNGISHQGRILSSVYGKLQNKPEDLNRTEFIDNFYTGGLDDLVTRTNPNAYAQKYINLKSGLGHYYGDTAIVNGVYTTVGKPHDAQKLSITFQPKKQYGIFGWDSWAKDNNDYCIEKFYENSGLTEKDLKAYGIGVSLKDGKTTITFDKSSPLANKILMSLPVEYSEDVSSTLSLDYMNKHHITINGIDEEGTTRDCTWAAIKYIGEMQNMYNQASKTRDNVMTSLGTEEMSFKSFSIPVLATGASEDDLAIIDAYVRNISSSNGVIYSNHGNSADDETLTEMDDDGRMKVINAIKAAKPDDLTFSYMMADGEVGLRVIIKPESITDDQAKKISKDKIDASAKYNGNYIDVFIPGLLANEAEQAINGDTATSAAREINDMKKYKYEYPLYNGQNIIYSVKSDGTASFINSTTKEAISDDDTEQLINKSLIIERAEALKYQYINIDNKLYDVNGFDEHAKLYAISAAIDLNPGFFTHTTDATGNSIFIGKDGKKYTIKDFFDKKGAGATVSAAARESMNAYLYKFYQDIFDVYEELQKDVLSYK